MVDKEEKEETNEKDFAPEDEERAQCEKRDSSPSADTTVEISETTTTNDSISVDDINHRNHDHKHSHACDHDDFDDGGVSSKEERARMVSRMSEALRRAREDGLPCSLSKKPPLSTALNYLARHNIRKRILHVGSAAKMPAECSAPGGGIAYPKLTKFIFDYRIRDPDAPEIFLDDTKKYGKKMELYCGKDFQIEVSFTILF